MESANSTKRDETISLTTTWIDQYSRDHSQCRLKQPIARGARLLYIGGKELRIVENQPSDSYVAFSYSWGEGGRKMLKTIEDTRTKHLQNVKESKLALSHRETIKVVRELKHNYIWIDALCIVHSDDDDWERQSLLVAEIYANTGLTLMAARSCDSRNGLLRPAYLPKADPV